MINLKIDLNQAKFLYAASQSATIQGKDAIFVANITFRVFFGAS